MFPLYDDNPHTRTPWLTIAIILVNLGQDTFRVERGMRVAQMVIGHCLRAELCESDNLDLTQRGIGGFGSTGKA